MAIFVRAFIVTTLLALALSAPVARREGKVTKTLPMVISQYSQVGFANRHSKNADAVLADAPAARHAHAEPPTAAVPQVPAEPAVPAVPKLDDRAAQQTVEAKPDAVEPQTSEKLAESPVPAADSKPEAVAEVPKADTPQSEVAPVPAADPAKAEVAEVPAEHTPAAISAPVADVTHSEVAPVPAAVPAAVPAEPVPAPHDDQAQPEQPAHEPVAVNAESKPSEIQEMPSAPAAPLPAEPSLNENLAEPVAPVAAAEETHAVPAAIEETHAEPEHAAAAISEVVSDVLPQTKVETTEVASNAEASTEKEEPVQEISTEQPAASVEEAPSVPVLKAAQAGGDEIVAQESESVAVATNGPVEGTELVKNTEATPQEVHAPENIAAVTSNSQERSSEEIQEVAESHDAVHETESDAESQELNNLREARRKSPHAEEEERDESKDDLPKPVHKAEKIEKTDKLEKSKPNKEKLSKSPIHEDYENRRKRETYF